MCGISDGRLQRRLLAEPNLKFKKALEISQAIETAEQGAKDLQQKQQRDSSALMKVGYSQKHKRPAAQAPPHRVQENSCYRCGGNHSSAVFKFKESTCHSCQKKGHIAKVCKSSPRKQLSRLPDRRPRRTHQVDQDVDKTENFVDEELDTHPMFNVQAKRTKPLVVTLQLNQQTHSMELDTGASLSIISEKTYNSL